jgi:hypothetical protein
LLKKLKNPVIFLAFREPLWYENPYDYGSLTGGRHDSHKRPQTATSLRPMGLSKPQTAADTGTGVAGAVPGASFVGTACRPDGLLV